MWSIDSKRLVIPDILVRLSVKCVTTLRMSGLQFPIYIFSKLIPFSVINAKGNFIMNRGLIQVYPCVYVADTVVGWNGENHN